LSTAEAASSLRKKTGIMGCRHEYIGMATGIVKHYLARQPALLNSLSIWGHGMDHQRHYAKVFEQLEDEYGKLDAHTRTPIIGFSAGGPVSMRVRSAARLFVTCELSVYEEQQTSTDGLRFEFFSKDEFDEEQARAIFTALGNLAMEAQLGNNHTIDVSQIAKARTNVVSLHLFSRVTIEGSEYGLYRVRPLP
jgi:hypothetical protein